MSTPSEQYKTIADSPSQKELHHIVKGESSHDAGIDKAGIDPPP
ncbi:MULTISPECIES: hypothetical protein [Aquitalea]|nr:MULTISPECIES: hypothetical protein [Aquitalea]